MTGIHVFDRLLLDPQKSIDAPVDPRLLPRLAGQMVTAAIASGKMLRELRTRMFPSGREPHAIAVAQALRDEFEQWAQDAEDALERAEPFAKSGQAIVGADELRDLIGMTKAMLGVTLDSHLRSLEEAASDQTVTIQELRRELQLKRGA